MPNVAVCRGCGKGIPSGGDCMWVGVSYKKGFYHNDCVPPDVEVDETEIHMEDTKSVHSRFFDALLSEEAENLGTEIHKSLWEMWPDGFMRLHLSADRGDVLYGFELWSPFGGGKAWGSKKAEFPSVREAWIKAVRTVYENCGWKNMPPTADAVTIWISHIADLCLRLELETILDIMDQDHRIALQIQTTRSGMSPFGITLSGGKTVIYGWGSSLLDAGENLRTNLARNAQRKAENEKNEAEREAVRAFMRDIQPGDLWRPYEKGKFCVITQILTEKNILHVGHNGQPHTSYISPGTYPELLERYKAQHVKLPAVVRKLTLKMAKYLEEGWESDTTGRDPFAPKPRYELRLTFGRYVFEIRKLADKRSKMANFGQMYGSLDYATIEKRLLRYMGGWYRDKA